MDNIRNFVIIAHIDHGKSTLADRMLEATNTIPPHKMRAQYLDQMELERERGITIKMAPVRMIYHTNCGLTRTETQTNADNIKVQTDANKSQRESAYSPRQSAQVEQFVLNLIDTPGHSDFSYEVSRSLKAVEGAVLLVDATQGIQAQTLANLESAIGAGLYIIGAVNKIDIASPDQVESSVKELAELLRTDTSEVFRVSGKTGEAVKELLDAIIERVPPPKEVKYLAALVFSSLYDEHKGVIAFVRIFGGSFVSGQNVEFLSTNTTFKIKEVGFFKPELKPEEKLEAGDIGYIATGIKNPDAVKVGDTIGPQALGKALPGFQVPSPVVFVSLYPDEGDDYENLKIALCKLRLHDSSFSMIPTVSDALGRGFQCGFLGRLHFEIVTQRLEKEFGIKVVNSFPSVAYRVKLKENTWVTVENPKDFPDNYAAVMEPIAKITIFCPLNYLGNILKLKENFRLSDILRETRGAKVIISAHLPLSDLISDFDDKLKSVSSGFASFSYGFAGYRESNVRRLDVLVAGEIASGLSRVVSDGELETIARKTVERLKELLPRRQFEQAIQAVANGRIIARETIPALKKDVTGYLYGGDRTRKMKLWKKQKKGKKKLKAMGRVTVSPQVFKELLKR